MAGCYGNSPEDRYFERMLFAHLDREDADEISFDDMVEDSVFVGECITESRDEKFSRLAKAIKDQDPTEVGQQFLDMIDEYWKRTRG